MKKITALDRKQLAGLSLDKYGTMIGWTLERLGWEHLKPAERQGPQSEAETEARPQLEFRILPVGREQMYVQVE